MECNSSERNPRSHRLDKVSRAVIFVVIRYRNTLKLIFLKVRIPYTACRWVEYLPIFRTIDAVRYGYLHTSVSYGNNKIGTRRSILGIKLDLLVSSVSSMVLMVALSSWSCTNSCSICSICSCSCFTSCSAAARLCSHTCCSLHS